MKIVLDTNVLISGLINPHGLPAKVLNLFLNGNFTVLYDTRIIEEYEEVLYRKQFRFKKKSWIDPLLDYIRHEGEYVTAEPIDGRFIDEDDKVFYEVAKAGGAESLVTGNKSHYPDEEMIQSPKEFIDVYMKKRAGQ